MFKLTSEPIVATTLNQEGAGGFVTFEGKVRNEADGRPVNRLEYEAYEELAESEGTKLVQEAIDKFDLISANVVHRVGVLELGETAVLIQVASAHRREAFAGCEWIIDQLKLRVPIWKKEHFADGESVWVVPDEVSGSGQLRSELEIEPTKTEPTEKNTHEEGLKN